MPEPGVPGRGGRRERVPSEVRNQQIRDSLEPLAPGERPTAVTIGAALAALLALSNIVLFLAGEKLDDDTGGTPTMILFEVVIISIAIGMYRVQYWAVLAFQCLLAISVIIAFLGLLIASNLTALVVTLAIMAVAGTLFWFLIRPMARIQARG